ncbi:hypothetical protein TNCV_4125191 [Trichonephila clavipes]|nr:hypothetical protein TNCV_4125191 [Trichonephila clavipes]
MSYDYVKDPLIARLAWVFPAKLNSQYNFAIRWSSSASFWDGKGCGSPVVKVSDNGRHVMSSSPVPLKTRRVGQRCTLNLSRAQTFSRGVVW